MGQERPGVSAERGGAFREMPGDGESSGTGAPQGAGRGEKGLRLCSSLSAVAWEPERSHRRPNAGIVSEGGLPGQVTPRSRDQKAHRLASTCESCSLLIQQGTGIRNARAEVG